MAQQWQAESDVLAAKHRIAHDRYNKAIAANIRAMRLDGPGIVPRHVTTELDAVSRAIDEAKRAINEFFIR
jgi:hypothetical protein